MMLTFLHLRDTEIIGDRWCSPYDWFDWPPTATVRDLRADGPDYDVGIYGGGKIFGGLAANKGIRRKPGALHIAWGVGTVQSWPLSRKYARARALCDLVGSRDRGDNRYAYAPCPSCMAPGFDSPPTPEHDIVFYSHAGKTAGQGVTIPADIPSLSNHAPSLEASLAFIASGRTVVSNSYHGVYWALLMGRRVIAVQFSNKFGHYHESPFISTPRRWLADRDRGIARPGMLSECRDATQVFKARVAALIGDRQ